MQTSDRTHPRCFCWEIHGEWGFKDHCGCDGMEHAFGQRLLSLVDENLPAILDRSFPGFVWQFFRSGRVKAPLVFLINELTTQNGSGDCFCDCCDGGLRTEREMP